MSIIIFMADHIIKKWVKIMFDINQINQCLLSIKNDDMPSYNILEYCVFIGLISVTDTVYLGYELSSMGDIILLLFNLINRQKGIPINRFKLILDRINDVFGSHRFNMNTELWTKLNNIYIDLEQLLNEDREK